MSKKNKQPIKAMKKKPISTTAPQDNNKPFLPFVEFPLTPVPMKLSSYFFIFLVFFSIFIINLTYLMPFVPVGDSGELITSAYLLGVSHPPGYPLFNLLGKLFSLIPIHNIAWRVNLSSLVFQLGASFFIYLSLYRLIKFWPAALLGALFYSFFPLIWEFSLKAEVFPLNNLFGSLILYLIVLSREYHQHYQAGLLDKISYEYKSRMIVYWTLFTCGLALTNHHTIILLAPGVLFSLYFYNRTVLFQLKTLLIALGTFLLGLMVYLYIPIRAHAQPYINWDDAQTSDRFIHLITRADYGSLNLVGSHEETYSIGMKYFFYLSHLMQQIGYFGLIILLLGLVFLFRQKDKKLGFILVLLYLFSSFFFITLANVIQNNTVFLTVLERFYMLSLVYIALLMGLGLYFLTQLIALHFKENKIGLVLNGFILLISMMSCFLPLKKFERPNEVLHHFGSNVLASVEKDAIVLTSGDSSGNVLAYLQQAEGLRKDVVLLAENLLSYPWYVQQTKQMYPDLNIPFLKTDGHFNTLAQLIEANLNKRAIYYVGLINDLPGLDSSYQFISNGIVTKITKNKVDLAEHIKQVEKLWNSYNLEGLKSSFSTTTFENDIVFIYAAAYFKRGIEYLNMGLDDLSMNQLRKALALNEVRLSIAYRVLGGIYAEKKDDPKNAIENFKKYIQYNPRDIGTNQVLLGYIQSHT